jgi:MSHA biogenesis protein MshN
MSLINQMLQELEQRKAPDTPLKAQSLQQVHAVSVPTPKRRLLPLALLSAILLAACGWSLLPNQVELGLHGQFALPSSATIINAANAESKAVLALPATMPRVSQVSFAPVLDRQLSAVPESAIKHREQLALISPSTTTQAYATVTESVSMTEPVAEKNEAQTPLSHSSEPSKLAAKLALLPKQNDKHGVNKLLNPAQQAAHEYHQAINYLQQGRVAESMDLLRKVLVTLPEHNDARQTLVGLLVDNHHHDEAMEVLKSGLNQSLAQPAFALTLARLQLEAGQIATALNTLEATLPFAKQQADYQALMAVVLQRLDRQQEAILHYQQALSLGGQTPAWLVGLAVALQTEGRAEEAKKVYEQAKRSDLTPELAQFVDQRLKQVSQPTLH